MSCIKSTKSNQTNLSNDEKIYHITTKLLEITKDAMNIARAELRDSFEKEVNNIWNIVRSDKDKMFSIRVNDDYDYEMITKVEETGEIESIQYTGGNQSFLAAYSVTLALAKLAPRKFPILIDNPFEQGYAETEIKVVESWKTIEQQTIITHQDPLIRKMNENGQAEKDSSGEEILIENLAHPCHKNNLSSVFAHTKFFRLERDASHPITRVKEVS